MRKNHILGTSPLNGEALFGEENLRLMRECGIRALRVFVPCPWGEDPGDREPTPAFGAAVERMRRMAELGFEPMPVYPMAAGSSYDPETGTVHIRKRLPEWFGDYEGDEFYENVYRLGVYLGELLAPICTWWQIANEPDGVGVMHDFTLGQNIRFLRAAAAGVKAGDPKAKCGINLGGASFEDVKEGRPLMHRVQGYNKTLLERLYRGNPEYDYVGLDGYFGSWSIGDPNEWYRYIADAAETARCTRILINEWGYSTLQKGAPRPAEQMDGHYHSPVCRYKDWDAPGFEGSKWRGLPHAEDLQADYIAECMRIFAEHPYVIGNLFFQWADQKRCWQCGEPDCPAECGWGCLRADLTPKPGYYALKKAYRELAADQG